MSKEHCSTTSGIVKSTLSLGLTSALIFSANSSFGAAVNISADTPLSNPVSCTAGSPLTPLCLVPDVVDNVLQADIFEVIKYDQRGTIFVGSDVEPHIAVDPTDKDGKTIAAAWMHDRAARLGGGLGLTIAISKDGGGSWTRTVLPFSRASGAPDMDNPGSYDRITDPWLAFDKNGNLYFAALGFDGLTKEVGGAVTFAKLNKGATKFGPVTTVYAKSGIGNRTLDKPIIIADPSRTGPNLDPILYSTFAMFNHSGKNDYFFATSADGGQTWVTNKFYTAETNADPGSKESSSLYGELVVLPNGTLAFVFIQADNSDFQASVALTLRLIRSFNGGSTWESSPVEIARLTPTLINDPEIKDKSGANIPIRGSENSTPAVSVDPKTSNLFIAYTDAVGGIKGAKSNVRMVRLSNAGIAGQAPTISAPVTVAANNAFMPAIRVASNGTVGVAFADMRNDVLAPRCSYNIVTDTHDCGALTADFWLKQYSPDFKTMLSETRLTDTSVDYRSAPLLFGAAGVVPGGIFLGDYFGLTSAAGKFMVAFPNTRAATSTTPCELTMNDPATGTLVIKQVGSLYLPPTPNAIAINKCNRNDIFFSSVTALPIVK